MLEWALFLLSGLAAGVINAVAGGGSFILFPLLVATGTPPVLANATTSICVLPGTLTSAWGYRKFIRKLPKRYFGLLIPALVGGLVGATLLGRTTNDDFGRIVPWFMVMAVGLLLFQPVLHRKLFSRKGLALERRYRKTMMLISGLFFFIVTVYGGYFGAGYGIIALAFLSLTPLRDIHKMNGLKNLGAISFQTTAIAYFWQHGLLEWSVVPWIFIGNAIGGYLGAAYSSKLPTAIIRAFIVAVGIAISVLLFAKYY